MQPTATVSDATATVLSSPTPTGAGGKCPGGGNTHHTASNGKTFLHICGVDYSGDDQAEDIGSVKATNFDECMEACAEEDECTGVGWGPKVKGNDYRETCWMKKGLLKSHKATPEWNFAVLIARGTNETATS